MCRCPLIFPSIVAAAYNRQDCADAPRILRAPDRPCVFYARHGHVDYTRLVRPLNTWSRVIEAVALMLYLFLEHRCDHARHWHGRVNHLHDRTNNRHDHTDVSRFFPASAWPLRCPVYFSGISVAAPIPCVYIRHRRGRANYVRLRGLN